MIYIFKIPLIKGIFLVNTNLVFLYKVHSFIKYKLSVKNCLCIKNSFIISELILVFGKHKFNRKYNFYFKNPIKMFFFEKKKKCKQTIRTCQEKLYGKK